MCGRAVKQKSNQILCSVLLTDILVLFLNIYFHFSYSHFKINDAQDLCFVCLEKFLLMTVFYSFKKLKDLTNVLLVI